MDNRKVHLRVNSRLNANIFSKLFFCWIIPYIYYGSRNKLETKDIFQLDSKNRSELLGDALEKCWKAQVQEARRKKSRPSFFKVIIKTFGCIYLKYVILSIGENFNRMLMPLVLKLVISHFYEDSTSTVLDACSYVALLTFALAADSLLSKHSLFHMHYIGGQVKTACSTLIYRKLLNLRINSQDRSNGGKMITLLSNDVSKFEEAFLHLHLLFILPIIMVLNSIFMWRLMGSTAILAVLIITLTNIPIRVISTQWVIKLRERAARMTDRRLLLIDEIINGIRVIKMYTWEKPLEQLVFLARRKELDLKMKKMSYYIGISTFAKYATSLTMYLIIAVLIYFDEKVTSLIMFPLIQYNFEMNTVSGYFLCNSLTSFANAKAAVNRTEEFLLLEEVMIVPKLLNINNGIIIMKNVSISWTENDNHQVLQNMSISIHPNKLYALVGEIGSGKSSFLKVILGELKLKSGQITRYGDISFANQEPWLFNGSLRSNILLGETFDEEKYHKVISSCALVKDFEQLPHGDKTIVGERGAALSGGQSARVNLARAVYRKADVYLLDDPLASIDYCVSKWLFEKCINGLLKDKARILVTQKLEYIKKADEIILINNRQLEYQGDYKNFQKTEFFQHLSKNCDLDEVPTDASTDSISSLAHIDNFKTDKISELDETEELLNDYKECERLKSYDDPEENVERIKHGNIPLSLLKEFYSHKTLVTCTLAFLIMSLIFQGGFDYLVALWSQNQDIFFSSSNVANSSYLNSNSNFSDSQCTLFYTIGGVLGFMLISCITAIVLFMKLNKVSCQKLHNNMISGLLRSAIEFFDHNDSGRILNRFSQDLGVIDEEMSIRIMELTNFMIICIVSPLQITFTSPYMSIAVIVSLFLVYVTVVFFCKTIMTTKRLEAKAKASVLSHSNTTFNGLDTIRASGAQEMFRKNFEVEQDNYMAAYFTNIDIFVSFFLWIDVIMKLLITFVAFSFVFLKSFGVTSITSATVGFVLLQTYFITKRLVVAAICAMLFELAMISIERTLEYTKLKNENLVEKKCLTRPASTWPSVGRITFDHLYLKYSTSTNPVLKNISFVIEPKSKVGIIGRTGAGKSSLSAALFRLAETEGSLVIDEIDAETITSKDLRKNISILPQKSILFSASLRKNLDPLEQSADANIWSALKCVQLDTLFNSLDEELDQKKLSSGQRQLLCLARVLLKKNKILILDEATANMDARTDDMINNTIKENFKDCTVLTISHKLNSVIDCDKILVIDAGQVVEYDEPQLLLQQKDGYFYKMWQALNNAST